MIHSANEMKRIDICHIFGGKHFIASSGVSNALSFLPWCSYVEKNVHQ